MPRSAQQFIPDPLHNSEMPDVLSTWLIEIGRRPLLTAQEEHDLAARIAHGDARAAQEMIDANLRLVVSVAKQYRGTGMELADLIQEGNIGLMRAVQRFDGTLGLRFSTYATWWIRQSINRALSDRGNIIRTPVYIETIMHKINQCRREYRETHQGDTPSIEAMAAILGITPYRLRLAMEAPPTPISLDQPIGDEEKHTLADLLPADDHAMEEWEHQHDRSTTFACIWAAAQLTPREQQVMEIRWGLDGSGKVSLQEAGRQLEVTRERVRQIECQAMRKLRHAGYYLARQQVIEDIGEEM